MAERIRLAALATVAALALAACGGGPPGSAPPGGGAGSVAGPTPASGEPVPGALVEAFDGSSVSLTDYSGTPLVVNFWASWCPPCIAEMPDLESVHQQVSDRVSFVGVNTQDTIENATRLVAETGVTYDLVRDPDAELFRGFEVFGMPSTFYVDADGIIVGRHTGVLTRDALFDGLREHLGVDVASIE